MIRMRFFLLALGLTVVGQTGLAAPFIDVESDRDSTVPTFITAPVGFVLGTGSAPVKVTGGGAFNGSSLPHGGTNLLSPMPQGN